MKQKVTLQDIVRRVDLIESEGMSRLEAWRELRRRDPGAFDQYGTLLALGAGRNQDQQKAA